MALRPLLFIAVLLASVLSSAQAQRSGSSSESVTAPGPVTLQTQRLSKSELAARRREQDKDPEALTEQDAKRLRRLFEQREEPLPMSDFERHVTRLAASPRAERDLEGEPLEKVRRFGADLLWEAEQRSEALDAAAVPDDYVIGPGDEVVLDLWGAVNANLRLDVSRRGSIAIPRVGSVNVAGLRFAELPRVIRARVAEQFRQFDLAVSMGALRQIRVYVTGFVVKPGVHLVSGAAGVTQVLAAAGGPTAVGSLRQVQLRRQGQLVETVDFYDLFQRGQLARDIPLQPGDVLHVPAAGVQVGVIGAVQQQAVLELKAGETAADALRMAGGFAPIANNERAVVVGLGRNAPARELLIAQAASTALKAGEVLRVHSVADLNQPTLQGAKRIRVEGEVARPGDYVLPATATLRDAVAAAGGLTEQAYPFGAEFNRESIRIQQLDAYERTLREMEAEFTRAAVTRRDTLGPPPDEPNPNQPIIHTRLVERLRQVRPSGRVVLQMRPEARELPAMGLEDGDRLYVPARTAAISVYGSVFNTGTYALLDNRTLGDYLLQAGGPRRGADEQGVFVLRADGSVVSNRPDSSWWRNSSTVQKLAALPGDTVFVPEELDKVRTTTLLKDWALILSQFGLGAVALKNLSN